MSSEYERYKEFSKGWDYNKMATNYDEEVSSIKCRAIDVITDFVRLFILNKSDRILDIGAGTGLCGENLKSYGYSNVDGLEPAEKMLDIAKSKSIYTNYFLEGISETEKTSIPENSYDAVISAGAFALEGHIQAGGLYEFIRVAKPGGLILITFRNEFLDIYKEFTRKLNKIIDDYEKDGRLQTIVRCVYPEYLIGKEGIMFVLKKLK